MSPATSAQAPSPSAGRRGAPAPASLVIEFVGLPGSGKTTMMEQLRFGRHKENGAAPGDRPKMVLHPVRRLRYRLITTRLLADAAAMTSFVLKHPRTAYRLVLYAGSVRAALLPKLLRCYKFCLMTARLDPKPAVRSSASVLLLDEGLVQRIAGICVPGKLPIPGNLIDLARVTLPGRIDALIWLECDAETSIARMASRPPKRGRIDSWPVETLRRQLPILQEGLAAGVQAARAIGIPVITLSSTASTEENAARVDAWIESLQHGPHSAPGQMTPGQTHAGAQEPLKSAAASAARD